MSQSGDARRTRIYQWTRAYIVEHGAPPTTQQIADAVSMSYSSTRYHLESLREAGQVEYEDGKQGTLWIPGMARPMIVPLACPGGPKWRGWREADAVQG